MIRPRRALRSLVIAITLSAAAGPVAAQDDSAPAAADLEVFTGTLAGPAPGSSLFLTLDSVAHVRLPGGLGLLARPYVNKTTDRPWRLRLIQLVVRKEHIGRVSTRIEAGFLPAPVGLGALAIRPASNPTVSPALAYGDFFPPAEPGAPPVQLYARTYPLGVQVSASSGRWDARLAAVDSSPLRQQIPFARDTPAHAAQLVGGGGSTLVPGVRLGGWASHGPWARASELSTAGAADRQATSGGVEMEVAFAWTRVAAEVTRARIETAGGPRTLSLAMIEGSQTLSPRWYVAGRVRHARSAAAETLVERNSGDATLGYRVSPVVTIRAGYYGLRRFGSDGWVHRATVGVLWARRTG